MEYREKIVEFEKYCPKCKHKDVVESEIPCAECLDEAVNTDSHKPVRFEEE